MNKTIVFSLLFACAALLTTTQTVLSQSKDWSGFYIGGNGFVTSDKTDAAATLNIYQVTNLFVAGSGIIIVPGTTRSFAASERMTSGGGGFQAGYQWQTGKFVIGAEADYNPFRRTASVAQSFQLPITLITQSTTVNARRDARLSREFSVRARAGAAFGKTLVYGTIGYAQARVRVSSIDTFTNPGGATQTTPPVNLGASGPVVTTASEEQNMSGWTGGFGVERKFGKRFSFGFEYRHTDYRSKTFALSNQTTVNTGQEARGTNGVAGLPGGVSTGATAVSLKTDSFAVRLNFHF